MRDNNRKRLVEDAVNAFTGLQAGVDYDDEHADAVDEIIERLIEAAGPLAGVEFVDVLKEAERASWEGGDIDAEKIVDSYFPHVLLVRVLARRGEIEFARAESCRFVERDEEDSNWIEHPVYGYIDIATTCGDAAQIEFALSEIRRMEDPVPRAKALLAFCVPFFRDEVFRSAMDIVSNLESDQPYDAALLFLEAARKFNLPSAYRHAMKIAERLSDICPQLAVKIYIEGNRYSHQPEDMAKAILAACRISSKDRFLNFEYLQVAYAIISVFGLQEGEALANAIPIPEFRDVVLRQIRNRRPDLN